MEETVLKNLNELFKDNIDVKDDGRVIVQRPIVSICFGKIVDSLERWTENKDVNVRVTEELGYVPLSKQVERLMQAGEDLIYTKLAEGTFSNDEGDEEFHDSFFDDISSKSYDELQKMYLDTKENFYQKRAVIAAAARRSLKAEEEKQSEKLSTTAPGAATKAPKNDGESSGT